VTAKSASDRNFKLGYQNLCYNSAMQEKLFTFKEHVRKAADNPTFVHHKWFVQWHLEIVEEIAQELLKFHPEADHDLVVLMVWLHDYGKILDFDDQYNKTLAAGREK
jgi:23S rRNA maturation-related 3'-5' exoribonuclease YhaM